MPSKLKIDRCLLIVTIILIIFGLLMVYSASSIVAVYKYDDKYYFFKRQFIYAVISVVVMILISTMDINKIYKVTPILFLIGIIFLILVLIPKIGLVRGGARSWIGIGSLSFQPSEFIKLAMILFLARILSNYDKQIVKFKNFFLLLILVGAIFGLIMLQPDFGTGLVIVLCSVLLLFISGAPFKYFLFLIILGVALLLVLIISAPYRLERIFAFIDPWQDPLGSGFQAIQSLYALAPSGLFGLGFNKSIQKHFFLPEPQNDFIFAIVCEELGLIGGAILLILFLILILRMIIIGKKLENNYYKYLTYGVSLSFFVQIFINIGVVIGLLPITGITLPIISYGGTSLMMSLSLIAVVLNVSRYVDE